MNFVFWMLSFKPTFSLSSFTFIKRLFSSSSLSTIRVMSSAYLRWLIFLAAILIPACASSSPGLLFPPAGYLPKPRIKPGSSALQVGSLPLSHLGSPVCKLKQKESNNGTPQEWNNYLVVLWAFAWETACPPSLTKRVLKSGKQLFARAWKWDPVCPSPCGGASVVRASVFRQLGTLSFGRFTGVREQNFRTFFFSQSFKI